MAFDAIKPTLMYMIGAIASAGNVEGFCLQQDKYSGNLIPNSAKVLPIVKYVNPVALWIDATFLGGVEPPECLPKSAVIVTLRCETGEHCVELLKQLLSGFDFELKGELISLAPLELQNRYEQLSAHPTHVRKMSLTMLLTSEKSGSVPILIEIEHKAIVATFGVPGGGCFSNPSETANG